MAKVFCALLIFSLLVFPLILNAATLSIQPESGSFSAGSRLSVRVMAIPSDTPFNAVSGVVAFPTNLFAIESVSKASSALDFWVTEPVISRGEGTVKFEGVALGGFYGSSATIITINLRALAPGSGRAVFRSGQVLANDGNGTDITKNLEGAVFYVTEAVSVPAPLPLPEPEPEEIPQPLPSLEAPEISLGRIYGELAIFGKSQYPETQALATFTAEDGVKIFILGAADKKGNFEILVPSSLKRGAYDVSVVMVKKDKTNSEPSNVITVRIGSIFSDVGWELWLLILLLVLAVIYLILRAHFHFVITKNSGPLNKRKLKEAEGVVHQSFNILREDIAGHKRLSEIKSDISEAEKVIEKKIKDIES